jgi:hypothetical protein
VKHRDWFTDTPVVAAGDFNSNVQWDANRPGRNHTEVVHLLEAHGAISAYHAHHGEKQGAETQPTSYLYRHQDKPFHIDYIFVPKGWKLGSVEIGLFQEWGQLSDHVPVVVDVSTGGRKYAPSGSKPCWTNPSRTAPTMTSVDFWLSSKSDFTFSSRSSPSAITPGEG